MSKISLKHSGGNAVSLNVPTSAPTSADVAFKLPNADGSANQLLKTDGSGNLGWATDQSGQLLQTKHKASGAKVSTTNVVTNNSFTSGAEVLSIAITPTVATSVIHITGMLHFAHKSDYEGYWWLTYNHSGISESMIAGNANTSMRRTGLANSGGNVTTTMQPNSSVDLMFDHNTTNEITFKIRMATSDNSQTMNFNRNVADSTDTSDGGNPISSITVKELSSVTITDDTVYRGT